VLRPQEYVESAKIYASDGRLDLAVAEMERLRPKALDNPKFADVATTASLFEGDYRALWAKRLLEEGKREEARAQAEKAEILYGAHRDLSLPQYKLGVLYFELGDPAKARSFFGRFLELEPQGERADEIRRLLFRLEGGAG
jgi:tetratricopeptide (TPR) repeat protein